LTGTGTVLCARDGRLVDIDVRDLVVDDWVALSFAPASSAVERVRLDDLDLSSPHGSQRRVWPPTVLDENLALLLGMYASEGHTTRSNWTVHVTNSVPSVLALCVELWRRCFGVAARGTSQRDRCPTVVVSSKTIVEVLDSLGCGSRASQKRIPRVILDSPTDVATAFLQGLNLDAYTTASSMKKWAICLDSPMLLDDLQSLLRTLGVVTSRISKRNKINGKTYDEVYATGAHARRLLRMAPFLEPAKAAAAQRLLASPVDARNNGADVVPLVHGTKLYAEIPKGCGGRTGGGTGVSLTWRSLCDKRTVWPSRDMVRRLSEAGHRLPRDVQRVLDEDLYFLPVVSAAPSLQGTLQ